jgi:hypothetical protein
MGKNLDKSNLNSIHKLVFLQVNTRFTPVSILNFKFNFEFFFLQKMLNSNTSIMEYFLLKFKIRFLEFCQLKFHSTKTSFLYKIRFFLFYLLVLNFNFQASIKIKTDVRTQKLHAVRFLQNKILHHSIAYRNKVLIDQHEKSCSSYIIFKKAAK